jgi:hypothetical protein
MLKIGDGQLGWLKEFLLGHCETDIDKADAEDIIQTFRDLWVVAKTAEKLLSKPPAVYQPHSRKKDLRHVLNKLYRIDESESPVET